VPDGTAIDLIKILYTPAYFEIQVGIDQSRQDCTIGPSTTLRVYLPTESEITALDRRINAQLTVPTCCRPNYSPNNTAIAIVLALRKYCVHPNDLLYWILEHLDLNARQGTGPINENDLLARPRLHMPLRLTLSIAHLFEYDPSNKNIVQAAEEIALIIARVLHDLYSPRLDGNFKFLTKRMFKSLRQGFHKNIQPREDTPEPQGGPA